MDSEEPGNTNEKSLTQRLAEAGFVRCSCCTNGAGLVTGQAAPRLTCSRNTEPLTVEQAKVCPGPLARPKAA